MILLINELLEELDLSKIDNWGILWGGSFSDIKYKNNSVKIPGGKIFDFGSDTDVNDYSLELITHSIDLEFIKNTESTIRRFCSDKYGMPKMIKLKRSFEPGYRLAKLSSMDYTVSTKDSRIKLVFSLYSSTMISVYGNIENIPEVQLGVSAAPKIITKKLVKAEEEFNSTVPYIGCEFDVTFNAENVKGLRMVSVDDLNSKIYFNIGEAHGPVVINSTNYTITVNGKYKFLHMPKDFKFYKDMYFDATSGVIKDIRFRYWSEWI